MVRFESRQRVNATIPELEAILSDDGYLPFVAQHHGSLVESERLSLKDTGSTIERKVRYLPRPVIESVGPKKIPPHYFGFVESSTYDKATKTLTFTNEATTEGIRKLLLNRGTMRLRDAGNGQTERIIEGEITLKVPLLLKPLAVIAEALIQKEGVKLLEGEANVVNKYVSEVVRKG